MPRYSATNILNILFNFSTVGKSTTLMSSARVCQTSGNGVEIKCKVLTPENDLGIAQIICDSFWHFSVPQGSLNFGHFFKNNNIKKLKLFGAYICSKCFNAYCLIQVLICDIFHSKTRNIMQNRKSLFQPLPNLLNYNFTFKHKHQPTYKLTTSLGQTIKVSKMLLYSDSVYTLSLLHSTHSIGHASYSGL